MKGRPRTSTLVLAGVFLVTLVVYLSVRPEPLPPTELVPAVQVPVITQAPRRTTTSGVPRTTTTAEETVPQPSVPLTTPTTTVSTTSTTTRLTLFPTTTTSTTRP